MTHPSDKRAYFFKIDTTIKKIRNALQKRFNEFALDITVDQWVVIDHLHKHVGVSQNILSEMTTKDAPTITRIIDLLVKKNLAERRMADDDRRKFNIFLTRDGNEVFERALPLVQEIRRQGWGNLSQDDYQHLVRIMDSIYKNFND